MKFIKKILNTVIWFIFIIIILYSFIIILQKTIWKDKIPSLFGYKNFIVLTDSMKPTINSGDLIIIKQEKDIEIDDIISFRVSDAIVTHRVNDIVIENGEKYYITKGDANNTVDKEVISGDLIEGKYKFKVPYIGKIIIFLKKPLGIMILLGLLGLILLINSIKLEKK